MFADFAMLQLAVHTGHTPASRSGSCPVHPTSPSRDFLSHKRGSCVLKKNGAFRSQSPLLAPPWGTDTIWPSWNYYELGISLCWKGGKAQWEKSPGSCTLWLMKCEFTWPPIADAHFMLEFFHVMSPLLAGTIVLMIHFIFFLGLCTLLRHKGTNPRSVQMKWM